MKVHPSHTGEVAAARATKSHGHHAHGHHAAKSAGTASFAGVLAQQAPAPGTDADADSTTRRLRKGESMAPVTGHAYGEISGGRRDGLFINTSGNARDGQAFVRAFKHGREYHIYGTGKDRLVVALKRPEHDKASVQTRTDSGGTTAPTVSKS